VVELTRFVNASSIYSYLGSSFIFENASRICKHIRFVNASSISSKLGSSFIFQNTLHHFIVNQYRFTLKKQIVVFFMRCSNFGF
jgi:hypothetical protein